MEFQFNFTILAIDELFDDEIHPHGLEKGFQKGLGILGSGFPFFLSIRRNRRFGDFRFLFRAGPSGVSGTVSSCSSKESGAAAFSASFTVTRTLASRFDESKKGILAFFQDLNEDIFTAYAEFLEGSLDSIVHGTRPVFSMRFISMPPCRLALLYLF